MTRHTLDPKALAFRAGLAAFALVLVVSGVLFVQTFVAASDLNPAGPGDESITLVETGEILVLLHPKGLRDRSSYLP